MASLQRQGDVFLIDLGDGENRFNADSLDSLEDCLAQVEADAPGALVTVASGKIWSNGLDLEWMGTQGEGALAFAERVQGLLARWLEIGVPTVAAIQGHVFAAGAMLALAHDQRVMRADRGYFCLPEIDIRIPFTAGMTALIASRLPIASAHEAMATGRRYGGHDALAAGIVHAAVGEEEVREHALGLAAAQTQRDPATLKTIKSRLYERPLALLREPIALGA